MVRLVAAVPAPYFHLLRYCGVLSSHSRLRKEVVPRPPHDPSATAPPAAPGDQLELELDAESVELPAGRKRCAWLLWHVFAADLDTCPRCSGPMRWMQAATTAGDAARRFPQFDLPWRAALDNNQRHEPSKMNAMVSVKRHKLDPEPHRPLFEPAQERLLGLLATSPDVTHNQLVGLGGAGEKMLAYVSVFGREHSIQWTSARSLAQGKTGLMLLSNSSPGHTIEVPFGERRVPFPSYGPSSSSHATAWHKAWYAALMSRDEPSLAALATISDDVLRASTPGMDEFVMEGSPDRLPRGPARRAPAHRARRRADRGRPNSGLSETGCGEGRDDRT